MYDVDRLGLDRLDRAVLSALTRSFNGGPVGVSTLAVAVGEEATTVEEVCEPFLVRAGMIARTPADGSPRRRPGRTWACGLRLPGWARPGCLNSPHAHRRFGVRRPGGCPARLHLHDGIVDLTSPRTRATFGIGAEEAEATKELAFNQGFYNLFLAVVAAAGIVAVALGHNAVEWR